MQKSDITFAVNGKLLKAYVASPTPGGPGVLVLPSWWGLKPFFKQVCDRLAEQGYTALAPDYYDGHVGQTIDEAKALQETVESNPEVMGGIVKAAKTHLASLQAQQPIAVLGFSMGADWAILTAAQEPDVAAVVLFYGFYNVDFSHTQPKVLGHYAETDEWQPLAGVRAMEQNMKRAGLEVTFHIYPQTAHWFMENDRPEYVSQAADLAWARTLKFLKTTLT